MSYRTKLMTVFSLTVVAAVAVVAYIVSMTTRNAFERLDAQRTAALVAQFRREFARRSAETIRQVEGIAGSEATLRMAVSASRSAPDYSAYVNEAQGLATAHQLELLELVAEDGTIISSAQWPARFGYKEELVRQSVSRAEPGAFLKREDLPDSAVLAIVAVRPVRAGDRTLFVVGGRKLDRQFLASLVLPEGMRALLYSNLEAGFSPASITDASGPVAQAEKLAPLIESARDQSRELTQTVLWSKDAASAELLHVIPLAGGQKEFLGALLIGSSRREQVELERRIRLAAAVIGGAGVLLGVALSGWAAARVTKPVERLAAASQRVAQGDWSVHVAIESQDELGQLADSFNRMTKEILEQRDRLIQAERVAAWRELARRLAHELKNPLFPLQITLENLVRAKEQTPEQFDEVLRESIATLLAELANMKAIIGRFSDFAKMPHPQLQEVQINDVVRGAAKLVEAQLDVPGRPAITKRLELGEPIAPIQADPDLLHRAIQNLVLNAVDIMPSGGTLTIRTMSRPGGVRLEVSDTGAGMTKEECERLFTPYYTTKKHGTGLGLAIVQSVVSDHGGKVSVESEPGRGTTFRVDLPQKPPEPAGG